MNEPGPNESPSDRPDLVTRVFAMKLDALMEDLTTKEVLGTCRAVASVIIYQKRGNIHCHIVLWTKNRRELTVLEYIDSVVSAENPASRRRRRTLSVGHRKNDARSLLTRRNTPVHERAQWSAPMPFLLSQKCGCPDLYRPLERIPLLPPPMQILG